MCRCPPPPQRSTRAAPPPPNPRATAAHPYARAFYAVAAADDHIFCPSRDCKNFIIYIIIFTSHIINASAVLLTCEVFIVRARCTAAAAVDVHILCYIISTYITNDHNYKLSLFFFFFFQYINVRKNMHAVYATSRRRRNGELSWVGVTGECLKHALQTNVSCFSKRTD